MRGRRVTLAGAMVSEMSSPEIPRLRSPTHSAQDDKVEGQHLADLPITSDK